MNVSKEKAREPDEATVSVAVVPAVEGASPPTKKKRRKAAPERFGRVMSRVASGASVLAACKAEGVARSQFLRHVEKNPELREQYVFAVAARAHALADELISIADGRSSQTDLTQAIATAVASAAPERAEAVARALASQQVQRDRLAFDARRWLASRLLPSVYGGQAVASPANKETVVRVTFEAIPSHEPTNQGGDSVQEADYEVL